MVRFALAFLSLATLAWAADAPFPGIAPANGWVLPLFTKEGFHKTTLRGDRATAVNVDRIDVVNIQIVKFSGDATAKILGILLAPSASYRPKENSASGKSGVRLIQYGSGPDTGASSVEISGDGAWTYDPVNDKMEVHRNVRISFKAQLDNILK